MAGNRVKIILMVAATAVVIMLLQGPKQEAPLFESRLLMDTIISLRAYPPVKQEQVDAAFAEFSKVESAASFHLESSELTALNQSHL